MADNDKNLYNLEHHGEVRNSPVPPESTNEPHNILHKIGVSPFETIIPTLTPPKIESVNSNVGASGPAVSFEEILEDLGCFGPFQALTLFCYLFMEVAAAFVVFIPVFVGRTVTTINCTHPTSPNSTDVLKYSIVDDNNDTLVNHDSTSFTEAYAFRSFVGDFNHILESPFQYGSVVEEWNLKCDKSWIPDAFESCFMLGMLAGNVIASPMSDWYGRRKSYLSILVIMGIGTLLSAFSPNIYLYACTRFVTGAGLCGFINVSCMAVMEFMTPKWRSLSNCIGLMGEGIILLSILGYFVNSWRGLYLATLTPYILIIPIFFLIPESPRWLLRNNRILEAHSVLSYMAKVNHRKPVSMDVLEALKRQEEIASDTQKNTRIGYGEFFRNRELLVKSVYLFLIWFSWNVAYYGISYNIRNVPGNTYFNFGLIGLANAVGQRVSMPVSDRFGRRKAVLLGMALCTIFLVALAICFLVMDQVTGSLIMSVCFIGTFGLACTRASVRLLSGETFPTAVRTMGLGVGGLGANVAGLITPQAAYLGTMSASLPFFIFAIISVVGSLVVFLMKETSGDPLSDEVQLCNDKKKMEKA